MDRYKGKFFSVLGDSISTFKGYSEPYDAAYYDDGRKLEANVILPEDTWWGSVIERLDGFRLINNSAWGSMVTKQSYCYTESYACSDERTSALNWNEQMPDVIMVYMGTNDWGGGVKIDPKDGEKGDISHFSCAYVTMLEKLKKNYPNAEIWCFTLPVSKNTRQESFSFPYFYGGVHIEKYCDAIRACAEKCGCCVIDLYRSDIRYDTIDGFHPNFDGMKTIADAVIAQLEA